jgi:hypothetical protein
MERILITLGVLLLVLFFLQLDTSMATYPIVRARLNVKESFENADADLANMRQPYHLLEGVSPSKRCYESKASKNIVLTGNYRQKTNNVMETSPESCTPAF